MQLFLLLCWLEWIENQNSWCNHQWNMRCKYRSYQKYIYIGVCKYRVWQRQAGTERERHSDWDWDLESSFLGASTSQRVFYIDSKSSQCCNCRWFFILCTFTKIINHYFIERILHTVWNISENRKFLKPYAWHSTTLDEGKTDHIEDSRLACKRST